MKIPNILVIAAAAAACSGCFQMSTTLKVNGDASGTIDQRLVFTGAALAQIQQFSALGGPDAKKFDPVSEDQARAGAAKIGPGVTYVTSTAINDASGQGRETTYAFGNVNQLRIMQQPGGPGGVSVGGTPESIAFTLTTLENGNSLLTIGMPAFSPPGVSGPGAGRSPSPAQLAMVRQMLAGARITIAVEPSGKIVRTSSPFVDGQRVTLIDIDLDQLMKDEVITRMRDVKSLDEMKAAMKDVPGLKVSLDRETTIEFSPAGSRP